MIKCLICFLFICSFIIEIKELLKKEKLKDVIADVYFTMSSTGGIIAFFFFVKGFIEGFLNK